MVHTRCAQARAQSVLLSRLFIGSLALYGAATRLWIYVLQTAPLSYS